ncbi:MAG: hypothetical protein AB1758_36725, partial [Candidatus Eremiobacterota bacterium]
VSPTGVLGCSDNHQGRVCQQILIGDLSVEVKGTLLKPGGRLTVVVNPAESVPLVVHNNGSYGTTGLKQLAQSLGGELHIQGKDPLLPVIAHYDHNPVSDLRTYRADRAGTYQAPPVQAEEGRVDTYLVFADGESIEVSFVMGSSPAPPPGDGSTQVEPAGPLVGVDPTSLQGTAGTGTPCPLEVGQIRVTNQGGSPVGLNVVGPADSHLLVLVNPPFPIGPGETAVITVFYDCSATATVRTALTLEAVDQNSGGKTMLNLPVEVFLPP